MINVLDFGAIGDGVTDDTLAIQTAINLASEKKCRVILPSGYVFRTYTIELKENVDFHIQKNATIKGLDGYDNYVTRNEIGEGHYKSFIYAKDANNISITGEGIIDGNCESFIIEKKQYIYNMGPEPRVTMLYLENCNNLVIRDVTITNGSYWTIHPAGCDGVYITDIKILQNLMVPNCDGIDPDHCKNVIIKGCHIECGDDCVVLKNTWYNEQYGGTKNVVVSDCVFISTSAGFKIGTESYGDFENITISNCVITDSNRGVSIQLRDWGNVKNIKFSNLIINTRRFDSMWWGKGEPIAITAYQRNESIVVGTISNITYSNITCNSENAIYMSGEKNKIKNIFLDNVVHDLRVTSKWEEHFYDNRPTKGQEHEGLFKDELVGLYANNIENLNIGNYHFLNDEIKKWYISNEGK